MAEFKPCPFCGSEFTQVRYIGWKSPCAFDSGYRGECCDCLAITAAYSTEAEAIAAWNTRAERTCRNVCEEWGKTSFAGAGTSFCCSECGAHYVDCECYYAALADADEEHIRTNYCPNCGAKVVDE